MKTKIKIKIKGITYIAALILCCISVSVYAHQEREQGDRKKDKGHSLILDPLNVIGDWQKITPPASALIVDGNNVQREITPSCSGGPEVVGIDEGGLPVIAKSDTEFSFYYREGSKEKLLLFFDGGGACWDGETCASTLLPALTEKTNKRVPSTYNQKFTPSSNPDNVAGIFDPRKRKNPFKEYSMIFIPYCTGDIHWGSNTAVYKDASIAGLPLGDLEIQHRGFDNFLAVREWIKNKAKTDADNRKDGNRKERDSDHDDSEKRRSEIEHLAVTGSSAGAYGAVLAFPYMKQIFPHSSAQLISDGGNGIITEEFVREIIQNDNSPWQARPNFPNWIPAFQSATFGSSDIFTATIYAGVAFHYPQDRIAQYTSAWDTVQTLFYNIMQSQDSGLGLPNWFSLTPEIMFDWHTRMNANANLTSMAPNYQYYVAPGCIHTTLRFSEQVYAESETHTPFYRWLRRMIKEKSNWKSETCDNTTCPPPSATEVAQCLAYSTGGV